MNTKLTKDFYTKDVLEVAHLLIGKILVRKYNDGRVCKYRITELEIYNGEEDTACHARVGKTKRTTTMYKEGGITYVYLCYGVYYLLNIVTGNEDHPEAILIRGIEGYDGPGKLTKALSIDSSMHELYLTTSDKLWIEDDGIEHTYSKHPRIGISYATPKYRNIKWRYVLKK